MAPIGNKLICDAIVVGRGQPSDLISKTILRSLSAQDCRLMEEFGN